MSEELKKRAREWLIARGYREFVANTDAAELGEFAESIVKEAAQIAEEQMNHKLFDTPDRWDQGYKAACANLRQLIRERFGVEDQ